MKGIVAKFIKNSSKKNEKLIYILVESWKA